MDGLASIGATINTSVVTGFDGGFFNSSRINMRNLGIYLVVKDDVEANRIQLYQYFNLKRRVKIYYKNGARDVFIEGYVEDINTNLFELNQTVQVIILCPQPYFQSLHEFYINMGKIFPQFEFPFNIELDEPIPFSTYMDDVLAIVENNGDVETGMLISIECQDTVKNPIIYNKDSGKKIDLSGNNGLSLGTGDMVIINTNRGTKEIILIRDTKRINIINHLTMDSTWLQLPVGNSVFTYDAYIGIDNMNITITHTDKYVGV